jgi:hypothetical protein
LRVIETNGRSIMRPIDPSPRRTATAMRLGERIITPSMTALASNRQEGQAHLAPPRNRGC